MKIALAHDYLNSWGGGERVLLLFKELYPEADVFSITHNPEKVKEHIDFVVKTSFLQKFGAFFVKRHNWLLLLMPLAVETMKLHPYDLILSDSSGFIKGVKTRKDAIHICYLHTTTRYLTTDKNYFRQNVPKSVRWAVPLFRWYLVKKDLQAAARPNIYIANSLETAKRCQKFYGRKPLAVIFPPVDTRVFYRKSEEKSSDYYLAAGRLAPYKRFDLCIEACAQLQRKLVIIGVGPEEQSLRKLATRCKADVEFRGGVTDEELRRAYVGCKAFLFPPFEDAGMTPLEAMACGAPVIAYGKGGALESVVEGKTGVFFTKQSVDSFADAILQFESSTYSQKEIIDHAAKFSAESFKQSVKRVVDEAITTKA